MAIATKWRDTTGMARRSADRQSEVIDAILGAGRVLAGVGARTIAEVDPDVTVPQFRVLVVLATAGPQRVADLASALDAEPSTATRLCDRLARKKLVRRQRLTTDRRTVQVLLGDPGRRLVDQVAERRRAEVARILRRVSAGDQERLIEMLRAFALAAGEDPSTWALGWAP
jgi:DNA-binding MarR family transcriptional regulator